VIIPELQLLEVKGKPLRGDSVVFDDPFLGVTPESFQAVDVNPAAGEVFSVIHPQVSITAEHECVVDLVAIGVDDAPSAYLFDREREDCFGPGVGNHLHEDTSIPLQNAKYRDFAGRPTTSLSFSLPAEVGLVHFDFASDEGFFSLVGVSQDGGTDGVDRPVDRIIGDPQLLGDLPCGKFQFEEFDQSQPLSRREISPVDPPSGEIVEGVAA